MKDKGYVLRVILKAIIVLCSIILSAILYAKVSLWSGLAWTITAVIWGMILENEIVKGQKQDYINFLEFIAYNYFCIMKNKEGELNAKSMQIDESKKHKGE